jgi:parallel beta-helix repeat protein
MKPKQSVLVAVVCIAVLMLTLGVPTAAARGTSGPAMANASSHTIVVKPNGHDDTADLQAAFDTCTSHDWTCTVQLTKGTYYSYQVTTFGFQGSFVGAGQGATIIQAQPNLPSPAPEYNTPTSSYWNALPGASNPWPAVFTFVGGSYQVSGMTLSEPYSVPSLGFYDDGVSYDSLPGIIIVTGTQASAHFDHVTVLGAPGDFAGYNLQDAIFFAGLTLVPGGTTVADLLPLSGSLSVTNSAFFTVDTGPGTWNLLNADLTVCFNNVVNSQVPFGLFDTYGSVVTFCGNRASDVEFGAGLLIYQGYQVFSQVPTTVYILGNDFQVSDGSNGVLLFDFTNSVSAVVSGNVIQTDTSCDCYLSDEPDAYGFSVITVYGLASAEVSGNVIIGGGAAGVYFLGGPGAVSGNVVLGTVVGVWADYASGLSIAGNVIQNSGEWGIAVTDSSSIVVSHNVVKNSAQFDMYWDGSGTGNVWSHNSCKTSSPVGLC